VNQSNKRAYAHRQPAQRSAPRPSGAAGNPRPAPARPAQPRPAVPGRRMPRGLIGLIIGGVIAVALAFCLQCIWPNGFPVSAKEDPAAAEKAAMIAEIHSRGPVRINEIMSSNSNTISLQDGGTPDWIEIANVSGKRVNLAGYSLSKSTNSASIFVFPELTLEAGECVLVYADSRVRDNADEDLHAPFRISASGDTLMLFNAADTAVDTVNIPALGRDQSYARETESSWFVSEHATPWLSNTEESYRQLSEKDENSPVIITELMASNDSIHAGAETGVYDYIELHNRSGEAVNLSGWYLSDDQANARKWPIPDVTLGAGEYLLIYASGLNQRLDPALLHTSFSLSSEGECAVLSNGYGQVMDLVVYDVLKSDQAYSLGSDGAWTTGLAPTPGKANS